MLDFAYSVFGERPVAEITSPEVLAVLRKVEARGRYETARRCAARVAWCFAMPSLLAGPSAIRQSTCAVR